jgi:hypothetical protein
MRGRGGRPAGVALARLRRPACRMAQARRHPGAPPPRVPGAAPGLLSLHPVLRDLPPVAQAAGPVDALGQPRRRHVLRRLRRPEAPANRSDHRRVRPVELFVAVLGASNYTYAEATRTRQLPDWLGSHQHALAFFGGVPGAIVPDQLKSGVTVPCRYEPGVQRRTGPPLRHRHPARAATWERAPEFVGPREVRRKLTKFAEEVREKSGTRPLEPMTDRRRRPAYTPRPVCGQAPISSGAAR